MAVSNLKYFQPNLKCSLCRIHSKEFNGHCVFLIKKKEGSWALPCCLLPSVHAWLAPQLFVDWNLRFLLIRTLRHGFPFIFYLDFCRPLFPLQFGILFFIAGLYFNDEINFFLGNSEKRKWVSW